MVIFPVRYVTVYQRLWSILEYELVINRLNIGFSIVKYVTFSSSIFVPWIFHSPSSYGTMDQSQEDRRRWDLALDLIRLLTSEGELSMAFFLGSDDFKPKKVVGSSRAEHRSEILMKRSMKMVDEIWGSHVKTFTHVYPVYPRRVPVDLSIMFHGWFGIWYKRDGKDYQLQTLNFTNSEMALSNPYAPWCWYIYRHLGDLCWANVGKYTSTMEHMGMVLSNKKMIFQTQYLRCRRKF